MDCGERMDWLKLLTPEREFKKSEARDQLLQSAFENDYATVIGSASFRRLQDKTQVFPLDRSDFVRTRLTHSLEVSALARSLGREIGQELYFRSLAPELDQARVHDLCDILHTAGLIHDIGNPPFGHYGETTIRDWFRRQLPVLEFCGEPLSKRLSQAQQADFTHFEGNAQALRLLTKLHFLNDDHGMDLTYALLNSIIKYPVSSLEIDPSSSEIRRHKLGYFTAETDIFQKISHRSGAGGRRHPLAMILEAADDIAYRTADIEDAQRKGHIEYNQLLEYLAESPRIRAAGRELHLRYDAQLERLRELRAIARQKHLSRPEQYALQNWCAELRRLMLADCAQAFADHYDGIMRGEFGRALAEGRFTGLILDVLGDIAYEFVFSSRAIVQMEISANTIMGGLLDKFVPAALVWDTDVPQSSLEPRLISIISDNYKACYKRFARGQSENEKLYLRLLLVTDYISGMTDSFAMTLYRQMHAMPV